MRSPWRLILLSIALGLLVLAVLSPFHWYFYLLPILVIAALVMLVFAGGDGL